MKQKKYEDEIQFKELVKKPVRLFGWVYLYFFIAIIGLGLYYVLNIDSISLKQGPYLAADSSEFSRDVEMKKGSVVPAANLSQLRTPSDSLLNAGEELYTQNCQSCHGTDGKGDGPAGQGLTPAPRNFHNTEGWINDRTIAGMYKTLQEGIDGSAMAAYEYLPVADRFAIIHYVRTFGDYPEITDEQITQLDDEYKLSEGTTSANQIPVSLAMQKMSEENQYNDINVEKLLDAVSDSSSGKMVFKKIVSDKKRAVITFFSSGLNKSVDNFKSAVNVTPLELGYKAGIVTLPDSELERLFSFLKSLESKIKIEEKKSV